jgi:hypothetical protein
MRQDPETKHLISAQKDSIRAVLRRFKGKCKPNSSAPSLHLAGQTSVRRPFHHGLPSAPQSGPGSHKHGRREPVVAALAQAAELTFCM